MDLPTLFARFGTALAIGLFIGLQREHAKAKEHDDLFAGTRTFALLALAGALAAYSADALDAPLVFGAGLLVTGALVLAAYRAASHDGEDIGLTTEAAALVVVFLGGLCAWGQLALAAALGVATAALLALKVQTRRLADELSRDDVIAAVKFAVISAIVLPVLPRETYGPPPFDVVSPYKVWLMVVFISGISFLGYVLVKTVGARRGVGLTGILGGLASSTAVTLSFAQRSQDAPGLGRPLTLGVLLAWTIMFARVLVEVAVVHLPLLAAVWLPITGAGVAGLVYAGYLYVRERPEGEQPEADIANPFSLGPAIQFGLLYGAVLIIAKAAQMYLGDTGVYLSAVASGLADVDAITLSMAELNANGSLEASTASNAIVMAAISNTLVKGGIVISLGKGSIRKAMVPGMLLMVATAGVLAFVF